MTLLRFEGMDNGSTVINTGTGQKIPPFHLNFKVGRVLTHNRAAGILRDDQFVP
jgi:hypothetical protein